MALAAQAPEDDGVLLPPPLSQSMAEESVAVDSPAPDRSQTQWQIDSKTISIIASLVVLLGLCLGLEIVLYSMQAWFTGLFFAVADGGLLLSIGMFSGLAAAVKKGLSWPHLQGPALLSGCGALLLCTSILFASATDVRKAFGASEPESRHGKTFGAGTAAPEHSNRMACILTKYERTVPA